MSTNTTRREAIENLLSKVLPGKEDEVLRQLQATLDKLGVDRKELKKTALKDKLATMQEQIQAKLPEGTEDGVASEVLAIVMGTVAEMAEDGDMAEPAKEEIEETQTVTRELAEQVKALAEESNQTVKDMDLIAKALLEISKGYKEVAPLLKKGEGFEAISERLAKLETSINARPRVASQAAETIIEAAELKKELEKGTEGQKVVIGFPVKE